MLSGGGISGYGRIVGPLGLLMAATAAARILPFHVLTPRATPSTGMLARCRQSIATGEVAPVIDRRFPLEATADAIRYVETERAKAKVVITIC